jgi:hypothetical protein
MKSKKENQAYTESISRLKNAIADIELIREDPKPSVSIEKIPFEESSFAHQKNKKTLDFQEVLNLGHIRSALVCLDEVVTTDTVLHARILNVISILKTIDADWHIKLKLND